MGCHRFFDKFLGLRKPPDLKQAKGSEKQLHRAVTIISDSRGSRSLLEHLPGKRTRLIMPGITIIKRGKIFK